jgi:hypothetical protein
VLGDRALDQPEDTEIQHVLRVLMAVWLFGLVRPGPQLSGQVAGWAPMTFAVRPPLYR